MQVWRPGTHRRVPAAQTGRRALRVHAQARSHLHPDGHRLGAPSGGPCTASEESSHQFSRGVRPPRQTPTHARRGHGGRRRCDLNPRDSLPGRIGGEDDQALLDRRDLRGRFSRPGPPGGDLDDRVLATMYGSMVLDLVRDNNWDHKVCLLGRSGAGERPVLCAAWLARLSKLWRLLGVAQIPPHARLGFALPRALD